MALEEEGKKQTQAFADIIQHVHSKLYLYLRGLLRHGEEAQDALQETYYDAWRATQRQSPPFADLYEEQAIQRWLFRVAYHRAIDVLRRKHRIEWQNIDDVDEVIAHIHDSPFDERLANREMMLQALALLSPADQTCLLLVVVDDLRIEDAAHVLDITFEACKKRLFRAKQRLLVIYQALAATEEGIR